LAARPKERRDAEEFEDVVFGMTVQEITTDVRISRNLSPQVQGVIVKSVTSGGVAQIGRVRPGVIIMAIGEQPTQNIAEYKAASEAVAAQKPSEVSLFATVGAATGFFRIEPRW
jgi:S1-C subfamily serine protease